MLKGAKKQKNSKNNVVRAVQDYCGTELDILRAKRETPP